MQEAGFMFILNNIKTFQTFHLQFINFEDKTFQTTHVTNILSISLLDLFSLPG